ncbi:gastrin-releasing peptide [Notechis scutatus]|uniref:Gastrin-releasing peptide n=1 Tax=Notechis scutatus TaxID=8663 RepID=A0A6J1U0B8_9SAUR|nr:gastrin-releasing peptide [Notechis scutatus]
MARPETLQLLPKPRGGQPFPLLALVAFALLLQGRGGRAASLQGVVDGTPPMAKIYPRGSHWAVGHFMGKKSTGDFPYVYEDRQEMPFSLLPDNAKQLGSYLQQGESFKELFKRMEEDEDQNSQLLREELPFSSKNVWGAEESSRFKNMVELLLQVLDKKESTPS